MDKNDLIIKTKRKIDEINDKIGEMKVLLEEQANDEIKKQSNRVMTQLEEINSMLQKQYSSLGETESGNKISEIEKNIYNSIQSFDSAFREAGSLFKTK